jgi:prepilin-type N-terminal cleavage/methylation domain-containing protein
MNQNKGFSLVEVLICVAIIAILAALIFPVFSQTRRSAQGTAAAANMRSLIQAARIYKEESGAWPLASALKNRVPQEATCDARDGMGGCGTDKKYFIGSFVWKPDLSLAGFEETRRFASEDRTDTALIGSPFVEKNSFNRSLADAIAEKGNDILPEAFKACHSDLAACQMPQLRLLGFGDGSVKLIKTTTKSQLLDWPNFLVVSPFDRSESLTVEH